MCFPYKDPSVVDTAVELLVVEKKETAFENIFLFYFTESTNFADSLFAFAALLFADADCETAGRFNGDLCRKRFDRNFRMISLVHTSYH